MWRSASDLDDVDVDVDVPGRARDGWMVPDVAGVVVGAAVADVM